MAADRASRDEGFGASASRLVSGDLPAHRALETELALFLGYQAVLVFPTGYHTNLGLLTTLAGPGDVIVSDSANHASIIDGCRLSRAAISIYRHADAADAGAALARTANARRRFLVTESLFSMDGDVAPLEALAGLAAEHDAVLIVDEAHALGALGPGGRGLCAAAGVRPDALVGTLGKSFGAAGGFVAGVTALRDYLVNRARSFIYTTGLPPPVAAAARAALALIADDAGASRRARLQANVKRLAELGAARLIPRAPAGPIIPIILGSSTRALAVAASLRTSGIFVPAIRPPTVPQGTARLRVTVSAAHDIADIDMLAAALARATA
jgi:8-amino-7-oxononanoate synthase